MSEEELKFCECDLPLKKNGCIMTGDELVLGDIEFVIKDNCIEVEPAQHRGETMCKTDDTIREVSDGYPCGPCSLPLKCGCGTIITEENVVNQDCENECEICDYCGNGKCPSCGEHHHCGGCI